LQRSDFPLCPLELRGIPVNRGEADGELLGELLDGYPGGDREGYVLADGQRGGY